MAQSRELWLCCGCGTPQNQQPQLLPQGDRFLGQLRRIFFFFSPDCNSWKAWIQPHSISVPQPEMRKSRGSLWDFCTGRSGAGKNWGCGKGGTGPGTGLEEGGFLEIFWGVFAILQPSLQLALCVPKANS